MTSSHTVAIFPWLDVLLVAAAYLAVAAGAWAALGLWRRRRLDGGLRYHLPVGAVHLGVVVALVAGLAATVFDSYAQQMLRYPDDFGRPQRFPDGFAVTVDLGAEALVDDGGRGGASGAFRAVAEVAWTLERAGRTVESRRGHTVFRDERPPVEGGHGPVRLMCEIIDYRYARYVGGSRRMIHPFIHRGLWQDVQLWFPAVDHGEVGAGQTVDERRRPTTVPVVLKVFPLQSWVWIGLALALVGGFLATLAELRGHRRRESQRAVGLLDQSAQHQP